MRWTNGDRDDTQVETAVEGADQVDARWEDQSDLVTWIQLAAFLEQGRNLLCPFV